VTRSTYDKKEDSPHAVKATALSYLRSPAEQASNIPIFSAILRDLSEKAIPGLSCPLMFVAALIRHPACTVVKLGFSCSSSHKRFASARKRYVKVFGSQKFARSGSVREQVWIRSDQRGAQRRWLLTHAFARTAFTRRDEQYLSAPDTMSSRK